VVALSFAKIALSLPAVAHPMALAQAGLDFVVPSQDFVLPSQFSFANPVVALALVPLAKIA